MELVMLLVLGKLNTIIRTFLTYGSETWTLSHQKENIDEHLREREREKKEDKGEYDTRGVASTINFMNYKCKTTIKFSRIG